MPVPQNRSKTRSQPCSSQPRRGDRVEALSHLGVRLEERLRRDPQVQFAELAPRSSSSRRAARSPRRRARLRQRIGACPQQAVGGTACASDSPSSRPGGGDQAHLELAGPPRLAHDEVAQKALVRAPIKRLEPLRAAPFQHVAAGRVAGLGGEQAVVERDDLLPRAGGVEAADERTVRAAARTSIRACCGSATAARRRRSDRAQSRRAGRSAAARRRPAVA